MNFKQLTSNHIVLLLAGPDERDIILMHDDVHVLWPDGQREQRLINFVIYGDVNGSSAMAKTVGLSTGIATEMVLNGRLGDSFVPFFYRNDSFIL